MTTPLAEGSLLARTGCFFCDPEPWRTLLVGKYTLVLAGAGPICPGYVMVAPRAHTHTVAELTEEELQEFLGVFELVKAALERQYRPGYTAYEHGRTGACLTLETLGDLSTFCHHAHRVVLPLRTNASKQLRAWFATTQSLAQAAELTRFAGQRYVYYESGFRTDRFAATVWQDGKEIPSQLMRRLLCDQMGAPDRWSWQHDVRYDDMIDTARRVGSELEGVLCVNPLSAAGGVTLPATVTLDGLSGVGKTLIAKGLAHSARCAMLDTGLFFRRQALCDVEGLAPPTESELRQWLLGKAQHPRARTQAVGIRARELAADTACRTELTNLLHGLTRDLAPCVVVGRDAWRLVPEPVVRVVLEASFDRRLWRRYLEQLQSLQEFLQLEEIEEQLRAADAHDAARLPPADLPGLLRVANDRRSANATLAELCHKVGSVVVAV